MIELEDYCKFPEEELVEKTEKIIKLAEGGTTADLAMMLSACIYTVIRLSAAKNLPAAGLTSALLLGRMKKAVENAIKDSVNT